MEERFNFFDFDDEDEQQTNSTSDNANSGNTETRYTSNVPNQVAGDDDSDDDDDAADNTMTGIFSTWKKGISGKNNDGHDFFENEDIPVTEPKVREETPEEKETRELGEITIDRRSHRTRMTLITIAVVAVLVGLYSIYNFFFVPYTALAQRTGYVMDVRLEGMIKNFEGEMISEEYVADTVTVYKSDFHFTIENDSVARTLMECKAKGLKMTVSYKTYHVALPWRGAYRDVVTDFHIEE